MANSSKTSPIMTEDEACLHALQYVNASLMSRVIETAVDLDVFGIISKSGSGSGSQLSSLEIASQLLPEGSPNDHQVASRLDSMLRLLAAHELLTCSLRSSADGSSETRVYGLAPASKYFTRNQGEGSVTAMMTYYHHPLLAKIWSKMKDAIIEGGDQFEKIHGMTSYQYARIDPTLNKSFNEAMAGMAALTMTKILKVYRGFDGLASLVDVGGGSGRILSMIITKHPSITGINFDLPHVVQAAPPNNDLGIKHIGGDMFVEIPHGDAILLKDILHNWSDKHCLKLLKNCHAALPEDGKVIIITMIPKKVPDSSFSSRYLASIDYIMMMKYTGSERNEEELKTLCKASGFSTFQVACSAYDIWSVVEFHIKHIGGDMFFEVPRGDAILLKDILHNWSDEYCLTLMKNCHRALPKNGKLIIISMIPGKVPDTSFSSRYDDDGEIPKISVCIHKTVKFM